MRATAFFARAWIRLRSLVPARDVLKSGLLVLCSAVPPLRRVVYNLEISPDGFTLGTGDMARDWDSRARRNARWYIYWNAWKTEAEFDAAGEADVREVVLKDLAVEPGARALEIGCGVGRLVKPLAQHMGEVHGVDISTEMVRQGRERLKDLSNVYLRDCDGTLSDFSSGRFDLCYSIAVFRHLPEKRFVLTYLAEAARVLKPAGILRFEVWATAGVDRRAKGGTLIGVTFEESEMREQLERLGFEAIEARRRPGLPYVVYTARRRCKPGVEATARVRWIGTLEAVAGRSDS